ncbi:hypothetical protein D3C71_935670 [compost metagenome]
MHIRAAQFLRAHHFAGRSLHQRRAAEKDRALIFDDHGLVAHGGYIGPARGATPHHHGDLRDALRRHIGLIVKDTAEMIAVGKHLVLIGQVRAAGIHQINTGQAVFSGDFLRAQMFLDRQRIIGAALHRRIIGDNDAFTARHPADAGDDPGGGNGFVIDFVSGELREFKKWAAGIEKRFDPVARQQFATGQMPFAGLVAATPRDFFDVLPQVVHQARHERGIGGEGGIAVQTGCKLHRIPHPLPLTSSRPISIRRISLVPAPIS